MVKYINKSSIDEVTLLELEIMARKVVFMIKNNCAKKINNVQN